MRKLNFINSRKCQTSRESIRQSSTLLSRSIVDGIWYGRSRHRYQFARNRGGFGLAKSVRSCRGIYLRARDSPLVNYPESGPVTTPDGQYGEAQSLTPDESPTRTMNLNRRRADAKFKSTVHECDREIVSRGWYEAKVWWINWGVLCHRITSWSKPILLALPYAPIVSSQSVWTLDATFIKNR